MNMCSCFRSWR